MEEQFQNDIHILHNNQEGDNIPSKLHAGIYNLTELENSVSLPPSKKSEFPHKHLDQLVTNIQFDTILDNSYFIGTYGEIVINMPLMRLKL